MAHGVDPLLRLAALPRATEDERKRLPGRALEPARLALVARNQLERQGLAAAKFDFERVADVWVEVVLCQTARVFHGPSVSGSGKHTDASAGRNPVGDTSTPTTPSHEPSTSTSGAQCNPSRLAASSDQYGLIGRPVGRWISTCTCVR